MKMLIAGRIRIEDVVEHRRVHFPVLHSFPWLAGDPEVSEDCWGRRHHCGRWRVAWFSAW